ncbi:MULTISPECIES: rhombotarget lipoprotein [unclassified Shewanella]|jgi:rhombotail lipoprotein|uniref:rhombotarget lipoprotein n=1 Tax=unclassified Shewanella TaxID=196818 RepID=UPI0016015679|nr:MULTISPECIES: rhombotarget lipoprotein [unclassified Shewanella]MBB1362914.1 rhombotarget lipoprotein [Shewanella sp. SR44-4]MBO1895136.1 rhombotarget lipoprotein [Shewanella sp. BF02_Schw]
MKTTTWLGMMASVFLLSSCSMLVSQQSGKQSVSSSLMDFLYPNKEARAVHSAEVPLLTLPVKVGIAFVPSTGFQKEAVHSKDQYELLEKVKAAFVQYDYIDRIEVIPSTYLAGGDGFNTLEQVGRLYDVDVMALVSYDQVTQSVENNAALLYWTIVGMYVIPGNENTVQTFVDTAVFDIKSRKMLFRAPGISKLEKRTTAIGIDETLAEKSMQGFDLAVTDMTKNLDDELARFKVRVKEEKIAKVEHSNNYSGGTIDIQFGLLLLIMLFIRLRLSKDVER